ncbi:ThuA domain-containing protein [Lentisphaera profundi]|uniref:ThuA domain-containing protein n=1 Tax=Lentisphaera profundi TaxID=1658616 RepID=A0ABY7VT25_9BACT|nr:ThuA domain-containing protein [Lentisphaera profundi]WDE96904.1 ThuA domain-containing protein [Lentisphaera profundi]
MKYIIITLITLLTSCAVDQKKTIKALYITGGCCHDYKSQQKIIPQGLAQRINIETDIIFAIKKEVMKEKLSKIDWAKGYDLVIYNICQSQESDSEFIDSITKLHHDGLGAIALHCSMHSYHWKIKGEKSWTKFLGVTSPNHGPKSKISVKPVAEHPIMKGFPKEWITPNGELYNISAMEKTMTPLAMGTRLEKGDKTPIPCIWVNQYGKGKVFATTLGHHNETMQSTEYLDMLSNAALWVTGQLD